MRAFRAIRNSDHDGNVGIVSVGDEGLVAVQHPVVAFADGGGAGGGSVGTGAGFSESPAAEPFAAGELGNIFAALLLGSGEKDVVDGQRIVRSDNNADGSVHGGKFFDCEHVIDVREPGAAVFDGNDHSQEAHLAELLHHFGGKLAGFVPLHHIGSDLGGGEVANFAAQLLLVLSERKGIGGNQILLNGRRRHDETPTG